MKIFRIILLVINLLLAVGLLLTTLAPVVPPSRSILPSLLAFGYLPLLVANVVMVVLWLLFGKWHFIWSVAAIALRWSFVGLFVQIGGTTKVPDRDGHPQMVIVMSYNVHNFHGKDDRASQTDTNVAAFLELLREYQPDILCLMEYTPTNTVRVTDSLTMLGYNHYYGAQGSTTSPRGTVVFSKLPITYVKRIDHNMLLTELMHDDQCFRLCSVHMDSYALDSTDREEIEQMLHGEMKHESQTLDKVKETVRKHESEWNEKLEPVVSESSLPMLLAGDFNDIPSSWLYAQVSKHLNDTYRDKGIGICRTYNGNGFPHFRIDYVFHSKEFQTLSYKRIKTDISDHYPVITSLELAK